MSQATDIADLKKRMTAVESSAAKVAQRVASVEAKVAVLISGGAKAEAGIAALDGRATKVELSVEALKLRLDLLESQMRDAIINIDSLKASSDGQRINISLLQSQVAKLQADVTALQNEVEPPVVPPTPPPPPPAPPPPPVPPQNRTTLTNDDFELEGVYEIDPEIGMQNNKQGGQLYYGQGFTHRYVNGKLRFQMGGYIWSAHHIVECEAPATFGRITAATNAWKNLGSDGWWHGFWWDEEAQRLWKVQGVDYPDASNESNRLALSTIRLNDDGTTTGKRGWWGLNGIPDRRIMGGVCRIPQWFQSQYSVGKYGVGFGGYASRMSANAVSLGLSLYAIGEPETTADNQLLPVFKTLSDHSSGTREKDWYAEGKPTSFDRGVCNLAVNNQYDKGNWNGVSPDGQRRWAWGATAANTGCWIDNDAGTRSKHGFLIVPTLPTGRAWYAGSSLNSEGRGAEIQVFDPAHLGEVANGTRQPWAVQPVAIKDISQDIAVHTSPAWGYLRPGGVEGANFDPLTNRLYVYCTNATTPKLWSHVFVYRVKVVSL